MGLKVPGPPGSFSLVEEDSVKSIYLEVTILAIHSLLIYIFHYLTPEYMYFYYVLLYT